jgi:hypothetical protein
MYLNYNIGQIHYLFNNVSDYNIDQIHMLFDELKNKFLSYNMDERK